MTRARYLIGDTRTLLAQLPEGSVDLVLTSPPHAWRPGLVLDPFVGSGTTLAVVVGHGHEAIGIDLDARNADLARQRVGPLLLTIEDLRPTPRGDAP